MIKAVDPKRLLGEAKARKIKLKKNALDPVDIVHEKNNDPKFKTELCKSWIESEFCIYGNKCRFAHGKQDIFEKSVNNSKYKQKNCLSFFQYGYCNYGIRCHFKHEERKLKEIKVPFYPGKLLTYDFTNSFVTISTAATNVTSCNNTNVGSPVHSTSSSSSITAANRPTSYITLINKEVVSSRKSSIENNRKASKDLKPIGVKRLKIFEEITSKNVNLDNIYEEEESKNYLPTKSLFNNLVNPKSLSNIKNQFILNNSIINHKLFETSKSAIEMRKCSYTQPYDCLSSNDIYVEDSLYPPITKHNNNDSPASQSSKQSKRSDDKCIYSSIFSQLN